MNHMNCSMCGQDCLDDESCLLNRIGALTKELKEKNLQIDELKKALYAECVGQACAADGECYQGYRQCTGCEIRAKKAYGEGWGK